jgi:hypothetical protein
MGGKEDPPHRTLPDCDKLWPTSTLTPRSSHLDVFKRSRHSASSNSLSQQLLGRIGKDIPVHNYATRTEQWRYSASNSEPRQHAQQPESEALHSDEESSHCYCREKNPGHPPKVKPTLQTKDQHIIIH